MTNQIDSH